MWRDISSCLPISDMPMGKAEIDAYSIAEYDTMEIEKID
jgi:hypothetical protein